MSPTMIVFFDESVSLFTIFVAIDHLIVYYFNIKLCYSMIFTSH